MSWDTITVGEAFTIRKGRKVDECSKSGTTIRYIQIVDLRCDDNIKYCEQDSSPVVASEDDVIIAWDGANAGTCGYGINGIIGSTLALLVPTTNLVNSRYAGIFLKTKFRYLRETCTGATIPHVSKQALQEIEIPLPSLETQQTIVQACDNISLVIAKRNEQIGLLDKLAQDTFVDMFGDPVTNPMGWEKAKMSAVCTKITDGTHQSPHFVPAGIPFLFVSNINNGKIDYNTRKFISEEEYNVLIKRTPIEIGDVLYTIVGSYGNPAVVRTVDKFCFQRHIAYLKPNKSIVNSDYLVNAMLTPDFRDQLEQRVKGIAQKTLNLSELKEMEVRLPSIEIQNSFANHVARIEKQKSRLQASLAELETTYKSILQKAFSGELF